MATRAPSTRKALPTSRSRKPLFSVSTDINYYDRTDPFAAFNALRKLLSFLPSKMGGCQNKLTAEEHKLSMHLLTILEPFIGITPSRRTITRQPTEILDSIVFFIDGKRDLLSLALTCHRMHSIVFPRHYDYRVIRARVGSLRVWNHLIVHRAFARNVRRLEILSDRSTKTEIVPMGIAGTDTDVESTDDELNIHVKQEKLLIAALAKMPALKSLTWSCDHSLVSIENVWPTLLKCQSLRHVEIVDNSIFAPLPAPESEDEEVQPPARSTIVLLNVREASFKSTASSYGAVKHPKLNRVCGVLNQCPNLQSLHIGHNQPRGAGYFQPVADDFLLCGRWKNLSSLTLHSLWCSKQGIDTLTSFLAFHASLEILHLNMSIGGIGNHNNCSFVLPLNSLPRLRELKANKDVVSAIMECTTDSPRPLETIKGIKLSGSEWDRAFLKNLRNVGENITKIELSGWNDMDDIRRLAECVPKLSWLDLGKKCNNHNARTAANNVNEWVSIVLSLLPELVTFHGVRFFYDVPLGPLNVSERSRVKQNDATASILAWRCPKMRRLDHWDEGSGRVIVLIREDDKVRYEVRRIKMEPKV